MQSYREPPIPPYGVTVEHDGCHCGDVNLPQAWGTREQCEAFIAAHLPPKGCEFGLLHLDSGRQVSYMVRPVARRKRIGWSDIT